MEEEFNEQKGVLEKILKSSNITPGQKESLIYLEGYMGEIFNQVLIDHLTGLYNKRKFDLDIKKEVHRAEHQGHDVSLVIYDIDDFKKLQDNHEDGHKYGDHILENVGKISKRMVHDFDGVYRIGGEEFSVILPNTSVDNGATGSMKRIMHKLKEELGITVSAGISNYKQNANNVDELIKYADRAMYESKKNKKNKITIYGKGAV